MVRVLILEDEDIIREYFTRLVQSIPGVTAVESAKTGEQALELVPGFGPDLVLLDYELRGQRRNGLQMGMEILQQAPGVKTVLISGYPPEYFSHQPLKPDGFLLKPIDKEQFQALVGRFANGMLCSQTSG